MKRLAACLAFIIATAAPAFAAKSTPAISGDYLEVRSCDVFTGPCFANAEMGLTGKEGILVWSVRHGAWNGVSLDGLNVIAALRTQDTLGNVQYQPRHGTAVLIVDEKATSQQQKALADLAKTLGGELTAEVVAVKTAPMDVAIGTCKKMGCASVKAGQLIDVTTRCLGGDDHLCGNEETFYPPLTDVQGAYPAFTEVASYTGDGLDLTWQLTGKRSAFIGSFSL